MMAKNYFSPYDVASNHAPVNGFNPSKKSSNLFAHGASTLPGNFQSTLPGNFQSTLPGNFQSTLPGNLRSTSAHNDSPRTLAASDSVAKHHPGNGTGHNFYEEPPRPGRYAKKIHTSVVVDSGDRTAGGPSDYIVDLGKEFEYVESIQLTGIYISNTIPNIQSLNNEIIWTHSILNIAPAGTTTVGPTFDPERADPVRIDCDTFPLWQQLVPTKPDPNDYSADLKGFFSDVVESAVIAEGYYTVEALERAFAPHRFYLSVDTTSHHIALIERAEELEIVAAETVAGSGAVYIMVAGPAPTTIDMPLIISDLAGGQWDSFAGIPAASLELVEFWNIDLFAGDTVLAAQYNTYEALGATGLYERIKLMPSHRPTPRAAAYCPECNDPKGSFVATHDTLTIFSEAYPKPPATHYRLDYGVNATIGRGIPFALPPEQLFGGAGAAAPLNELNSLPTFLGITVDGQTRFIHTNTHLAPRRRRNRCCRRGDCCEQEIAVRINKKLRLERQPNGEYTFVAWPYILMRIIVPERDRNTLGGNLVKTASTYLQHNTTTAEHNLKNLFAKIRLGGSHTDHFTFNTSILHFYERPLAKLGALNVQFLDGDGRLLDLVGEHNFTLEITAIQDVLHNTLQDTRNGTKVSTGYDAVRSAFAGL